MAKPRKIYTATEYNVSIDVRHDRDWNEYYLEIAGENSGPQYHTDNRDDAIETAHQMAAEYAGA